MMLALLFVWICVSVMSIYHLQYHVDDVQTQLLDTIKHSDPVVLMNQVQNYIYVATTSEVSKISS